MTSLSSQLRSESFECQLPAKEKSPPGKPPFGIWFWFGLVLLMSALYMAYQLKHGWLPSDDGALAESAEQVLHGAIPHRDFHEIYTGLLSCLNAAAFRALGTNLASMRYAFFIFFLVWVVAFYYAATRLVSPAVAAATTLLAVAWGPPTCATPMPSWYNLFFATFGLACLLRYIEVEGRRWLIISGLCGGISVLFKMTGLYFVAGVLLFLAFREQMRKGSSLVKRGQNLLYRVFLILSVLAYEALLLALLRKQANAATYVYFWLPNLAIGAMIFWCEFHADESRDRRFTFLFRELGLFGVGVAIPVAIFLMPYLLTGGLNAFFADLLIQPREMMTLGGLRPSVQWLVEGGVMNLLLMGVASLTRSKSRLKLWEIFLLGTPLALLIPSFLLLAHQATGVYQLAWSTAWVLAPFVLLVGMWLLRRWIKLERLDFLQRQRLFVIVAVTATCGLIQFPFSIPFYYCYIAPLVVLAAAAVVSFVKHPPRLAIGGMMCFCLLYAVFELTPGYVFRMGLEYAPDRQTTKLSAARGGGFRTTVATEREYAELDSLIRQHAQGEYILAAPNFPQVYFLYGFHSPVRDFYRFSDDFEVRSESVLANLEAHHINFIVLNHLNSMFVQAIPDDLHRALERQFPNQARIERLPDPARSPAETEWFEVRWKQ